MNFSNFLSTLFYGRPPFDCFCKEHKALKWGKILKWQSKKVTFQLVYSVYFFEIILPLFTLNHINIWRFTFIYKDKLYHHVFQYIRKDDENSIQFLDLVNLVLIISWQTFNSKFYQQTDVVAVEGPASSTIAFSPSTFSLRPRWQSIWKKGLTGETIFTRNIINILKGKGTITTI